jgi:hypothetical protein
MPELLVVRRPPSAGYAKAPAANRAGGIRELYSVR